MDNSLLRDSKMNLINQLYDQINIVYNDYA
jgi:hypothetical protein